MNAFTFVRAPCSSCSIPTRCSGLDGSCGPPTVTLAVLRFALEPKPPDSSPALREAIDKSGFRWRAARVVLTSTDPHYQEKLDRVQGVLSTRKKNECFFSIDEYGPFSVKAIPGRSLAGPGELPTVPQWQKSRGRLIVTAALELSKNQVTHFYSSAKNTAEMTKLIERLLVDYADKKTLYLSWDAASWHDSKQLKKYIEKHNSEAVDAPRLELVPLPASSQFLNVIESVFSCSCWYRVTTVLAKIDHRRWS